MFSFQKSVRQVRPRGGAAGTRRADGRARAARGSRHAAGAAVPGRARADRRRHGLLLGRRAHVLAAPGRLHDRGRLRGRLHAEPDLRGGLLRPHRAHRGRAGRLRSGAVAYEAPAAAVLGEPRPDAGHAPGQRRRHPVPLGDLLGDEAQRAAAEASRAAYAAELARAGYGRITTEIAAARRRSTTPSTTTSSTSRRTRTATAGSAAPASPARSGSPRADERLSRRCAACPSAIRTTCSAHPRAAGQSPHARRGRCSSRTNCQRPSA